MRTPINTTIFVATIIVIFYLVITLSAQHDEKAMQSMDKYEQCVKTKMHTTVIAYYDKNGEYPKCEL